MRVDDHDREDRVGVLRAAGRQLRRQLRHLHAARGQVQARPGQEGGPTVQQGGKIKHKQLRLAQVRRAEGKGGRVCTTRTSHYYSTTPI